MDELNQILEKIAKEPLSLVFISTKDCGVCHADKPRLEKLAADYNLPFYEIDAAKNPAVAGTFQVLTVPAVLFYYEGREFQRQARFIDFRQLEKIIQQAQRR